MNSLIKIDKETTPNCRIEERVTEWKERQVWVISIFDLTPIENKSYGLETTINLYGINNFKTQLNNLYNKLLNHEEENEIENYEGKLSLKDREKILNKILYFIDSNKNKITPWEKYNNLMPYPEEEWEIIELEKVCGIKLMKTTYNNV